MTSRSISIGLFSLVLSMTGCPETPRTTVSDCDDALAAPAGTPCDFTGQCGSVCPGTAVECIGGLTVQIVARCDGGTPLDDAGPLDASPIDASPIDAGASDASSMDAGPLDAGMCMPRAPLGVTPCRGDSDCSAGAAERCRNPDERPGCGICMDPPRDCAMDADCPAMDGLQYVCEEAEVSCPCSGDGLGTFCLAPCSVTGCEDGWTCAASGHCEADACDAGYACPLGTTCGTAGAAGDAHGCVRASCATDADCPCGAGCVEGQCFDVLGTCEGPRG